MGPDNPQDSSGPSFSPNGRFWTRFEPFLMLSARLGPPGPGQGLAGRPWEPGRHTLFFLTNKKKTGFFNIRRGVGYPPLKIKKARLFFYSEGVRSQIGISGSPRNADLAH